jgi:hypothetical protein
MRSHKTDTNQREIVAALRKAGCSVHVTSDQHDGFPDLVVGRTHRAGGSHTYLIEVKSGPRSGLTPAQKRFRASWRGHYAVASGVDEALIAVGLAK